MVCRRSSGSSLCVFVVVVCIKTVLFAVESHLRLIELIYRHGDAPTFTRLSLQMRPIFSLFAPPKPLLRGGQAWRRLSIEATPHLARRFVTRSHTTLHRRANRQRGAGRRAAVLLTDDSPLVVYSLNKLASRVAGISPGD